MELEQVRHGRIIRVDEMSDYEEQMSERWARRNRNNPWDIAYVEPEEEEEEHV